jgi:uncharacterized membrane protein
MPEDGQHGLGSSGTEGSSATRVGPAGWPAEPGDGAARPARRRRPGWAPWLVATAVFAVYTVISLFRYFQINPSSWDLGIFTELVKQYAHLHAPVADVRGAGFNLLGDHFSPIVALIAPFFLIVPSPGTLLVAQAFLTAISVLPVTWAAQEKLGRRAGLAVGTAYGFSWGLQQMVNFDFHEIAFAVPLLAFSMSALARGRYRACAGWALPLVFVKEDQGFTVAAIGSLMIIVSQWHERTGRTAPAATPDAGSTGPDRAAVFGGQFLIIWGIVWSVVAIGVIIPHFNPAHHYQYWSDGGSLSPGGHFSAGTAAQQLFTAWPAKLQTTLMILLPTAFIALWSPLALAAVPSILLRFFGTNSNYWGTDWHYNATVMPIVFIAAIDAIARIRAARARAPMGINSANGSSSTGTGEARGLWRWAGPVKAAIDRHGAAAMLAIAVALIFQFPVGTLWNPLTYHIDGHEAAANGAMAKVPDGATVTTTLDLLAPLAARTDTFWIGNAGNPNTTYIVFDGQNSGYSPEPADVPAFIAGQHPGVRYQVVYDVDDVYVFRLAGR